MKVDKDGVQVCEGCEWPKAWNQEWQTDYCDECQEQLESDPDTEFMKWWEVL